jgi:hypothetical protein
MRRLLSVVLVAMLVSVALLPPEHVHVRPDGHSYTHRHLIVAGRRGLSGLSLSGHAASDHSRAIFLNPSFLGRSMYGTAQPALAALRFLPPRPDAPCTDGRSAGSLRINGPPPRALSSRAPPLA